MQTTKKTRLPSSIKKQIVEKLIKSLLDYNNIKFSHIHDIVEKLIDMLNNNKIYTKLDIKKMTLHVEKIISGKEG